MGINKFGSFLNEKRKEKRTIRELSKKLDISSSYLCDLEQGRKLPPIQDGTVQLYDDLIVLLNLTTEEIEEMYSCIDEDLAENNRTAPDITSYISQNHSARVAFREIKDLNPDKDDFEAVLKMLREKTKEKRPVFKDSQIDDIALNLLSSNYPEYLIKPTPVNIEKITSYNPLAPSESLVIFVTIFPLGSEIKYFIGNLFSFSKASFLISKVKRIDAVKKKTCCKYLKTIIIKVRAPYIIIILIIGWILGL